MTAPVVACSLIHSVPSVLATPLLRMKQLRKCTKNRILSDNCRKKSADVGARGSDVVRKRGLDDSNNGTFKSNFSAKIPNKFTIPTKRRGVRQSAWITHSITNLIFSNLSEMHISSYRTKSIKLYRNIWFCNVTVAVWAVPKVGYSKWTELLLFSIHTSTGSERPNGWVSSRTVFTSYKIALQIAFCVLHIASNIIKRGKIGTCPHIHIFVFRMRLS